MKKKSLSIETTIIVVILILLSAFLFIKKTISNDLFFDLKTGENILKYGIDFKDHFSFIPNLTYLYHHWLYDLIVLGIYSVFNYNGLFIFFFCVFSLFGISLFIITKSNSNKLIATLIAILTMYITSYAFQFRVQSITYLLFLWEVYALEKLYKTGKKRYSIYLALIAILVVNLHMPLWIFCLILYLPYLAETLLCLLSKKIKWLKHIPLEKPNNSKILIITFVILLFTGLCSPLRLNPYTFFAKSLFNDSFNIISEMKKTTLFYQKELLILTILFIFGIYFKYLIITIRDFFLLIGLFIFSLIATRNVIYFLIFAPMLFVKDFNRKIKFKPSFITNKKRFITTLKKFNYNYISVIIGLFLTCTFIYSVATFFQSKSDYELSLSLPDKSVNYIKENIDYKNTRLFTDFDFGSFVAYNDIPIFVDSRAEVYIKEFNGGKDIINDLRKIEYINTYTEVLNKYNFDYLIVYYNSNLDLFLKENEDYTLLYTEMDGVMYSLYQKTA